MPANITAVIPGMLNLFRIIGTKNIEAIIIKNVIYNSTVSPEVVRYLYLIGLFYIFCRILQIGRNYRVKLLQLFKELYKYLSIIKIIINKSLKRGKG